MSGGRRRDTPGKGPLDRWRARGGHMTALLWRGASMWSAAIVVAAFPFLFILDERAVSGFSPVRPGMIILVVLWILLPIVLVESLSRRWRHLDDGRQAAKVNRLALGGQRSLLLAGLWLASWLALGA